MPRPPSAQELLRWVAAASSMMASSRCSVETYSSCIRSATACASVRTRRASFESVSWAVPRTLGSLPARRAAASADGGRILADPVEDRRHDAVRLVDQR